MPDDWPGHPQRKDYPLGGIPVEYKGGTDPAPDQRRSVQLMSNQQDMYADPSETSQGKVFTVTGQDWDSITQGLGDSADERVVVNMGPQHPSTHGVLRLILELEGETVTEARCGIGYLHTGIEKNMEFRSWVQGVTFCTRMDYLSPFFNEATYSLGVERLLDIEDDIPEKAQVMRVLLMELNRISSHLVCIATGGMEIGALTVMTIGFRERELVLDLFELITGLRMNHAFIRPGGVAQDLPPGALDEIRDFIALMRKRLPEYAALCNANPIFKARLETSATSTSPAAWRSGSPARRCARPATPGTCARRSPTPATRTTTSRSRPGTPPTPTAASACASTRWTSRSRSSSRPPTASPTSRARRSWSPTRRSPGPASSRSAPTAWATPSTTSATSWASRWRP